MSGKKSEGIDILKLYAEHMETGPKTWNRYLSTALAVDDVQGLTDTLRRLQMGMTSLANQKLNTPKVIDYFLRLQRSIENTIRDIHRKKNPNPLYVAKDKSKLGHHMADKKKKQEELERFLKRVRY